jgi:hypothetical protein
MISKEKRWEEGFRRLLRFVQQEGHCRVPRTWVEPEGYPLGNWVAFQRTQRRRGKLTAERARRLQRVAGWEWNPRPTSRKRDSGTPEPR